jgi:hypothetical protein
MAESEMVDTWLIRFYGNTSAWLVVVAMLLAGLSYVARGWLLGRPAAYGIAVSLFALAGFYLWFALYPERLIIEARGGMVRVGLVILCAAQVYFNRADVGMVLRKIWQHRGH